MTAPKTLFVDFEQEKNEKARWFWHVRYGDDIKLVSTDTKATREEAEAEARDIMLSDWSEESRHAAHIPKPRRSFLRRFFRCGR